MKNPNTNLWTSYQQTAEYRGELAAQLLLPFHPLAGLTILDLGCGSGGIAKALIKHGAHVTAMDPDPERIKILDGETIPGLTTQCLPAESLDEQAVYDVIILNDVLEHTINPDKVLYNCQRALVQCGLLYLVTPNRWSLFNAFCDPHYSIPFVSMFPRTWTRFLIAQVLKWHRPDKPDFPQLFSRFKLESLLGKNNFTFEYVNRQAATLAMSEPRYIWSRKWHLQSIHMIKRFKIEKILLTLVNNKPGIFNAVFNPVWYIIAKRR